MTAEDLESGARFAARAKVVINATGPFTDSVRRMADPRASGIIAPSQGAHIVLDRSFLPGDAAIMVPHTSDGRVMFAIPWLGHTLVGTTDTPIDDVPMEPVPMAQEIEFMLDTAALYLHKKPARADILSTFAGVRPLVKAADSSNTAALSRDHTIHIDQSGLINITGGKWTTYRNMAEDCVDQAATLAGLPEQSSVTRQLRVRGYDTNAERFGDLRLYGADAALIQELVRGDPVLGEPLHADLPICGAQIVWAAREEMARTVEDILGRRTRALFLNVNAAVLMAPRAAQLMAQELGRDQTWQDQQVAAFGQLAKGYTSVQAVR